MLMQRPAAYFKAVKRREPRQLAKATENLIFKRYVKIHEVMSTSIRNTFQVVIGRVGLYLYMDYVRTRVVHSFLITARSP